MSNVDIDEQSKRKESEALSPYDIVLYAIETTEREKMHAGYSTPLNEPVHKKMYYWQGRLHPTEIEVKYSRPGGDKILYSNARKNLVELAHNLAQNCKERENAELTRRGQPSYKLNFLPPQSLLDNQKSLYWESVSPVVRGLTEEEQELFLKEFQAELTITDKHALPQTKAEWEEFFNPKTPVEAPPNLNDFFK